MQEVTGSERESILEQRRNIVRQYFETIKAGRFNEGLNFFAPECVTHNPYFAGDMSALTEAMVAANREGMKQFPNAKFVVRHVMVDGDMVMVHTDLMSDRSDPRQGGLRQAHLFRFDGDKIIEYWDITQQLLPDQPNAAGAF